MLFGSLLGSILGLRWEIEYLEDSIAIRAVFFYFHYRRHHSAGLGCISEEATRWTEQKSFNQKQISKRKQNETKTKQKQTKQNKN